MVPSIQWLAEQPTAHSPQPTTDTDTDCSPMSPRVSSSGVRVHNDNLTHVFVVGGEEVCGGR